MTAYMAYICKEAKIGMGTKLRWFNTYQALRGKPVVQPWMLPAAGGAALTGGMIGRATAPRRRRQA